MRNPDRLDRFYKELRNIHKSELPDWRFGQFMMNFFSYLAGKGIDPFFPEESKMIGYLHDYIKEIKGGK